MRVIRFTILFTLILITLCRAYGQTRSADANAIYYQADICVNAGSGNFAPYYIASNQNGTITQADGIQLRMQAHRPIERNKRFSWGAGADMIACASNTTEYMHYSHATSTWTLNPHRPSAFHVQQLYGQLKWRSVFLTIGLKQYQSALFDSKLASGDYVESGNARPIPQIRTGLLEFRDIPLTGGWIQIQGELAYGKPTDNGWLRSHFNYYNNFITTDWLYHYKRIYFRTRPDCNLSVTLGMQAAGQFCGTQHFYVDGSLISVKHEPFKPVDLIDILFTKADDSYYKGNHLGSWDMKARYRMPKGDDLCLYFQWPWEDGSGIGKLNGFDGIWGIEWKKAEPGPINGIVAELLYFMNQSGPIHCDPDDLPGTDFPIHTDGADDYYNNYFYNGYAYYGMGIGSPVFPSPLYNTDGYLRYTDTRLRGFHIGISGEFRLPGHNLSYRLLGGYREAFGNGYVPRRSPVHNTSWLIEGNWSMKKLPALTFSVKVAMDHGNIYGNQTGFLTGITYTGILSTSPHRQ